MQPNNQIMHNSKKVLLVFGTRPEAIKMAPLVNSFKDCSDQFESRVCVTAQHREMLDQVLEFFKIVPDYDLDLMKPNQDLFTLTSIIIESLKPVLDDFNPDFVFVHGDTTTSMASALAAFYHGAKVCHVEAGLRTNNKHSPFPEEINRQITSRISDFHFAPTDKSKLNLINENIPENKIFVTGNSVIDALLCSLDRIEKIKNSSIEDLKKMINKQDVILVTGHRRENHGKGFDNICMALKEIAHKYPDIIIIYPVHLNPKVKETVYKILSLVPNIKLIDPLSYPEFIWLMNRSKIILTDSGGIQEEAPSLGKPVLVMRDTTERPEAVDAGTVILVGSDKNLIVENVFELLSNNEMYKRMSELHNPYGDGLACSRMLQAISNL